jgi:phosphoenolpyruvate carboxykinase (diphosphate)
MLLESLGHPSPGKAPLSRERILEFVNLKLASRGFVTPRLPGEAAPVHDFGRSLLANYEERFRLFGDILCPVDQAIHQFLASYLREEKGAVFGPNEVLVPSAALTLERHGLARELSLPADSDRFSSPILTSSRVYQGVCHNPAKDRRTTEGVFHIVEGGLPIPADKKGVPKAAFAHLLWHALHPPEDLLLLPYTANLPAADQARTFVSLLLRPMVGPEVSGVRQKQSMEIRFFAPGILVSNLDFVESIFGNAGDPYLPEKDARLDVGGWSGHTGCVILAPHLCGMNKKALGLPHISQATERQRRDGMCWESEDELYNNGTAFKVACRDQRGVMVTLIADSYYGYCKKEVKTQISYATNLYGQYEEEHAGGALAFPQFDLGEAFSLSREMNHTWPEMVSQQGHLMHLQPEGYGIDKQYPDIIYIPETAQISLRQTKITWPTAEGGTTEIKLLAGRTYVLPSGYKVEMCQSVKGQRWRLVGTQAEGTFCHKPCTVSGGGKSEISKSLSDAMITGPVILRDFAADVKLASEVMEYDFSNRFKNPRLPRRPSRPLLSPERSFGSVVRMLTPSDTFTDAYNAWLQAIPRHVRDLVLVVKRRYQASWGEDWKQRFSVDSIDGLPGIELKYRNQKLVTRYLRVGFQEDGTWRTFGLRKDFSPAVKLQREDDITASVVVPAEQLTGLHPNLKEPAYKFSANCEYRLFQRPDDAVIRGYDRVTEVDFTKPGNFFSNYEPLPRARSQEMTEDAVRFGRFTPPLQEFISKVAKADAPEYFVSPSDPRIVDGKPSKNPRYLQTRPDLDNPRSEYLAEMGARLFRRLSIGQPVLNPVSAVLPGRRNNPAEAGSGIRPLAVYGPIHYQELPELFADYIASLTGKSPSTTGAGSEGALTKGPFNALLPIHDLNAALVSMILTGSHAFISAAGHVGRKFRVEHDISLIIPEIWARMHLHERDPEWLLDHGCLEPVRDFKHEGRTVAASRLGYRITENFVQRFFGRVFADSAAVFTDEMLRPERQSLDEYVDGVDHIVEGQQKAAAYYFEDGSIELAIPPLKALLTILAKGEGDLKAPEFRRLFDRETVLQSDWYLNRLKTHQLVEQRLLEKHLAALSEFLEKRTRLSSSERSELEAKLALAKAKLAALTPTAPLGTLGTDPALV